MTLRMITMKNKREPLSFSEIQELVSSGKLCVDLADGADSTQAADTASADTEELPEIVSFTSTPYTGGSFKQWWSRYPIVTRILPTKDSGGIEGIFPLPALSDHVNACASVAGQHNMAKVANNALTTAGDIYPRYSATAAKIFNLYRLGYDWQLSIAGPIVKIVEIEADDSIEVNGQMWYGPLYVVEHMILREITFVPVGAVINTKLVLNIKQGE